MINEKQVKKYCSDNISMIENYQAAILDKTQTWHCHHRLEIQGPFRNSLEILKKCGLYYKVPAWQLIFLTKTEHHKLHGTNISDVTRQKLSDAGKNKIVSEKTKEKLRIANTGENNPQYGKRGKLHRNYGKHHSAETLQKMSIALSGENHPFYGKHHSAETLQKMSEARKGCHWWNNGIVNKRVKECPGPEWKRGRLFNL